MGSGRGGNDVERNIKHKKIDTDGHFTANNSPPPATNTSNETNAANLVGCGWFWTTRLCGWAAAGEVDVLNIIFGTQK
jgi:hypothetical protein